MVRDTEIAAITTNMTMYNSDIILYSFILCAFNQSDATYTVDLKNYFNLRSRLVMQGT